MVRSKLHILVCAAVFLLLAATGTARAGSNPALYEPNKLKAGPQLFVGQLSNVGSSWQTVLLPYAYDEMVVVASPAYTSSQLPAVVRIKNANDNSFEIRVQNPSGQSLSGYTVQYLVVEEGEYNQEEHGVTMEAVLENVKKTDYAGSWDGEFAEYENEYENPVVVGQVMTFNDERWSVFWSHGIEASMPPSASDLHVGKHVGEDQNDSRGEETIGYVVFESSTGILDGYVFQAIAGDDVIRGMDDGSPNDYAHELNSTGFAVVSQAGMSGSNGSWAVLWGDVPLMEDVIQLALDEDQLADEERVHLSEHVHALIFSVIQPVPEILSFSPGMGAVGDEVILYGNFFTGAQEVLFNGVPASFTVLSDQTMTATVPVGASSGLISVTTPGGQASSAALFILLDVPEIFTFQPEEGPRGTVVEITGKNFVGVEDVTFGGRSSQSYEVVSDTRIIATVPIKSNTGRIRVRNGAGMATTPEVFRIISTAAVEGLIPDRAEASATISITGAGFLEAESVQFAGGAEAEFTILSDEEIKVTVPLNSISGPINVVLGDGTVLRGPVDFTLTFALPLPGLNLCRLTTATMSQSSTSQPFATASKACDGITEGNLVDESFTDTQTEAEAWWEADLGGIYNLAEVAVWNREDCCQDALSDFYIFVSDAPFPSKAVAETLSDVSIDAYFIDQVDLFESIDIDRSSRYIRIQKQGIGSLVLAEVEIVSGTGNVVTSTEDALFSGGLTLEKSYPSPFQSQTTITYHLAKIDHVYLSLFDVLGREVQVLHDGIKQAGTHQASLQPGDLPNGVYFYRLLSGGEMRINSVVLAR